jgi:hypothetical protein
LSVRLTNLGNVLSTELLRLSQMTLTSMKVFSLFLSLTAIQLMTRLPAESTKSEKTPTLPKISPISSMLAQANQLLLSLGFTKPLLGWPPYCPPCYWWNGSTCVYDCNPNRCEVCKQGSCQSKCDSDNCMVCDGSGSCVSACYSNSCLECDGHGFCESRCDPNLCEECDGQGNCVDRCDTDELFRRNNRIDEIFSNLSCFIL